MANPLHNEQEIYDRIEKEKINLHPLVWGLLNHHIRNDIQVVMFGAEEIRHTLSAKKGPLNNLIRVCENILARGRSIDHFLEKLKVSTKEVEL